MFIWPDRKWHAELATHLGVLIGVKAYEEMKSFVTMLDHSLDLGFCQCCKCTAKKAGSKLQMRSHF
jgi:hypothetical protein